MEKRVLIAIFLSFLVLYVYQALVVKPVPKPAPSATTTSGRPGTTSPAAKPPQPSQASAPSAPAAAPTAPAVVPLVGDSAERDVRVETDDVIATFTNRGARLKSWRLKKFFDGAGHPLELVVTDLGPNEPLPFSLDAKDAAVTTTANDGLYTAKRSMVGSATHLTFEYATSQLRVVKEFAIEPASYIVAVRVAVKAGGMDVPAAIVWGPAVGDVSAETSRYVQKPEGLLFVGGKVQRLSPKDLAKQSTYDGDFGYAGVDDHYFMTVALFPGPSQISFRPISIPPSAGSKETRDLVAYTITPGHEPAKFFFGPKRFDTLAAIDRDLTRAINFGIFAVIVVPLLKSLNWIYGYVGNYGWSIVLLTVIINAIMFPLRHKSVVSMRKMQEIQPEIKAIQDRYAKLKATDPAKQKMNQEMMALYRTKGVNPASGCVPMLLTFPVLYAFYALLSVSIELRGAPFFGWIHDLSVHDPYFITPVLMGVSQLWQQRITPAAGADPTQQKMMMLMPAVFTVMFLWMPAGLAVYWFMSNAWGIGQQYLTNYLIGPPKIHTIRPAAERRVKRVGPGKTEAATRES